MQECGPACRTSIKTGRSNPPTHAAKDPAGLAGQPVSQAGPRFCCAVDTAGWISRTALNGVCRQYGPVCMRGITSAMQRPIFPFPAREHRYLEPATLLPSKANQPTAVPGVSTITSSGRAWQLTGHSPQRAPRPHPAAHGC